MKTAIFLLSFLFLATATDTTQDRMIQGIVSGARMQPISGVTVSTKDNASHAITNKYGWYEISVPPGYYQLHFKHPEYVGQTITIGDQKTIHVSLLPYNKPEDIPTPFPPETKDEALMMEYATMGINGNTRTMRKSRDLSAVSLQGTRPDYGSITDGETNWNTEDYDLIVENRFFQAVDRPLSTFSIDVDAASYSNLRRFLQNGRTPPVDAVRIEEMINYFEYDYPQPDGEHPFSIVTEVSKCPWNPQHQLVHIGLQGRKIPTTDLPPSNLTFLIDVSGSMNASNKLPLLKSSFKMLVDNLREQDRVSIVVYAGAAGIVLPATAGSEKSKILEALEGLSAGGSTAGGAGIQLAYQLARENFLKEGNNRVILATDGDFNVGVSSDAELVRIIEKERESGVFLTVLGLGSGNYKDNKMQQLAKHGNGNHAYIDNIREARKVMITEFGGTMFTIAKDVKIQVEFNPANVGAYRLLGYENRLLNDEDFADDNKDAGDLGSGHTVTALYEIIPPGIKSEWIQTVDSLIYQQKPVLDKDRFKKELMTVKLRYKDPKGAKSKLLSIRIGSKVEEIYRSSDNFRWSAAVAEFGLLLRNSKYRAEANLNQVLTLANNAKGEDRNGYRSEFIQLAQGLDYLVER